MTSAERSRKWREANRERSAAASQARRGKPLSEARKAAKAAYYEANQEAIKASARARYEARKAAGEPLNLATPEAIKRANHRKRDRRRVRVASSFVEPVDRQVVWERDGGICHICLEPADVNAWHLDHVLALVDGGEHSYANTAVSHPACNLAKEAERRRSA